VKVWAKKKDKIAVVNPKYVKFPHHISAQKARRHNQGQRAPLFLPPCKLKL
jgi:hypothetical protein